MTQKFIYPHICTVPIEKLSLDEFMALSPQVPIFDARSPSEHAKAHIPGALSFPIFSDEERKIIGTAYKQESREKAIKLGLDFFGRKMVATVEAAEKYFTDQKLPAREVRLHCWRGGMRSAAMAWLLDLYGFKVYLLKGGYKAFRQQVLKQFEKEYQLSIIGGYTGGNKTGLLQEMSRKGMLVIDLEKLAGHMGSAFGNLDNIPQPSQEQFENLLAMDLIKASLRSETIWLEGESQRIGNVNIPVSFFKQMRLAKVLFMDIPFEARLAHIISTYGHFSKEKLINAIVRIKKRLGGLETKNAVNALLEDDVAACFTILLRYYDKLYLKSTNDKTDGERIIVPIVSGTTDPGINFQKILIHAK